MRRATQEDVDALEELDMQLFPDSCLGSMTLSTELEHGDAWVIVLCQTIIAYVITRTEGDLVDILRIGVSPSHRRKGLATSLLTKAMCLAPVAMLTVRKDNEMALRMYHQRGFHIVGTTSCASWLMTT